MRFQPASTASRWKSYNADESSAEPSTALGFCQANVLREWEAVSFGVRIDFTKAISILAISLKRHSSLSPSGCKGKKEERKKCFCQDVCAYKLRYMAHYGEIFISREEEWSETRRKNLIKCKLLLLINEAMCRVLRLSTERLWCVGGSSRRAVVRAFPHTRQTIRRVNQVMYGAIRHYFHVEATSVACLPAGYIVYRPSNPHLSQLSENNNFDHNKAAKIISRGSWLNIVDR